ncbi:MAG: DUF3365 domain-containing protein [Crocinitomicaceae bacterium]|nr:DUF3365 domain-containing protein [Crocinitomicaceae bacterium]
MKRLFTIGILFLFVACSGNKEESQQQATAINEVELLQKGDSIATLAQGVLMQNVSSAIQQHGVIGAIEFCNLNAIPLTDSISQLTLSTVQRLSDKNRNPNNEINTTIDQKAWSELKMLLSDSTIADKHFLLQENNQVFYYKPIQIGMPTCLKCHGAKGTDISDDALSIIQTNYPNDKATDYQLGQLRGMWKIKIKEI